MGGLFTILKVRDQLKSYDEDPGWYQHPAGTVALKASDADLARDGIDVTERVSGGASSSTSGTIATAGAPPTPRATDTHKGH
jgi:hypothetical protein